MFRTYITFSKAGHYTVTIHAICANGGGQCVHSKGLISSLMRARQHAAEWISQQEQAA